MKKTLVFLLVTAALIVGGKTAFAEDGLTLKLGYGIAHEKGKVDIDSIGPYYKTNGNINGTVAEVTYNTGPYFIRGTFNYFESLSAKETFSSIGIRETIWSLEADMGYTLYAKDGVSLSPYLGFGYREWKFQSLRYDLHVTAKSPYAAVGLNTAYTADRWTSGLDLALLLSFGGKISETGTASVFGDHFQQKFGAGARVQIPVEYDVISKKANAFGLMVFATPYYEYWNLGKSVTKHTVQVKPTQNILGIKGGVGLAF